MRGVKRAFAAIRSGAVSESDGHGFSGLRFLLPRFSGSFAGGMTGRRSVSGILLAAAPISVGGCGKGGSSSRNGGADQAGNGMIRSAGAGEAKTQLSGWISGRHLPDGMGRLLQLNGTEIRRRLVGQRIRPDSDVRQTHVGFFQDFRRDGIWASSRAKVAVFDLRGNREVVGDQIYVAAANRQPSVTATCHPPPRPVQVWVDRSRGQDRDAGRGTGPSRPIPIMSASSVAAAVPATDTRTSVA
jgi:hypothetical protein